MISKIFTGLFAALLVFGVPGAIAQEAQPAAPSKKIQPAEKPVMLGDQILFYLAADAEGLAIAKRAGEVSKRIKRIADSPGFKVDLSITNDFKAPMTFMVAGDEILTAILNQDAASTGKSRQELAADNARIIRTTIEKYRKDRSIEQLIYGTLYTLIAGIILIAILIAIGSFKHKIDRRIDDHFKLRKKGLQVRSVEIVRAERMVEMPQGGVKGVRLIFALILLYVCLQLVPGFFPATRPVADRVLGYILSPLTIIGKGFIDQIPNLLFITVLALLGRYILKGMKTFFLGVEQERVKLHGFYPEPCDQLFRRGPRKRAHSPYHFDHRLRYALAPGLCPAADGGAKDLRSADCAGAVRAADIAG